MAGIIEFPKLVQEALVDFGDLFANDCQQRHFAEYLTGLFVAAPEERHGHPRRVRPDHRPVLPQPLPHLRRWDVEALNERRLELLQKDAYTRYSDHGIIAVDNTLVDHCGILIDDVGWFWDHAEERNKIAQDYLIVNYVCTSGKHYPLEFRLFRKREMCEALNEPFRDHTELFWELIDWVCVREIPGDFALDCYFTNAEMLNYIHGKRGDSAGPVVMSAR